MRAVGPEMQLCWMVAASVVVAGGFITWLWLMSVYPSATVAAFSFLTPVLAVFPGWAVFGETLGPAILGAALLGACGIVRINRAPRPG